MGSAVRGVSSFVSNPGRVFKAAITGGASELVRAGGKVLDGMKPDIHGTNPMPNAPFDLSKQAAVAQKASEGQLAGALSNQQEFNAANKGVATQLGQIAEGNGPSLAAAQLKAAQDRNLSQLLAAQAAARGQSGALGARNLALAATSAGRGTAQDAAQARLGEAQQARQMLMAGNQAANQQAGSDIGSVYNYSVAPNVALQDKAKTDAGIQTSNSQLAIQNQAAQNQLTGSIIGAGGAVAGGLLSDEKQKENIKKPSHKDMSEFLEKLSAKTYKYKNPELPGASSGKKYGITAQDLEKSRVGKTMVKDTPQGKMVDMGSGFGAVLASQAELHKRISELEKKKK